MAEIAMHWVQQVIPQVPVRQSVLSPPPALRYLVAYDATLSSAVLNIFVRTVFAWLKRTAVLLGYVDWQHRGSDRARWWVR